MTRIRQPQQADGLYDPRYEHDACGVAVVARLDNRPSNEVVRLGIEAVATLEASFEMKNITLDTTIFPLHRQVWPEVTEPSNLRLSSPPRFPQRLRVSASVALSNPKMILNCKTKYFA